MHDLRIAAVVALHKLRGFQLVVVRGSALPGAGLRMSSFGNSHDSVSRKMSNSCGAGAQAIHESSPDKMGEFAPVFSPGLSFRSEFTAQERRDHTFQASVLVF